MNILISYVLIVIIKTLSSFIIYMNILINKIIKYKNINKLN